MKPIKKLQLFLTICIIVLCVSAPAYINSISKTANEDNPTDHLKIAVMDKILGKTEVALESQGVIEIIVTKYQSKIILSTSNESLTNAFGRFLHRHSGSMLLFKDDAGWHISYEAGDSDYDNSEKVNNLTSRILRALEARSEVANSLKHKAAYINFDASLKSTYEEWLKDVEKIVRRNNPNALNIDLWMDWSNWSMHYQSGVGPYEAYGRALMEANNSNGFGGLVPQQ